ncbi:hypothetical protein Z945_44 [Sulfitobacter noctilucae]|nr:hypothetical protein Z945_44 [Sulfitobacter noctilucae]
MTSQPVTCFEQGHIVAVCKPVGRAHSSNASADHSDISARVKPSRCEGRRMARHRV